MARRAKPGSGVLAGIVAAIVAWYLWVHFLSTDSTVNFNVNSADPSTTANPTIPGSAAPGTAGFTFGNFYRTLIGVKQI